VELVRGKVAILKVLRVLLRHDRNLSGEVGRLVYRIIPSFSKKAAGRRIQSVDVIACASAREFVRFNPHPGVPGPAPAASARCTGPPGASLRIVLFLIHVGRQARPALLRPGGMVASAALAAWAVLFGALLTPAFPSTTTHSTAWGAHKRYYQSRKPGQCDAPQGPGVGRRQENNGGSIGGRGRDGHDKREEHREVSRPGLARTTMDARMVSSCVLYSVPDPI
jgi:hypothetical protein